MEHGSEMGCWWLGGGGLWLEGLRDGEWLWDGELVAERWRVGGGRVEGCSIAVRWGVGGWGGGLVTWEMESCHISEGDSLG